MKENKEYQEKKEQEKVVHEPTGSYGMDTITMSYVNGRKSAQRNASILQRIGTKIMVITTYSRRIRDRNQQRYGGCQGRKNCFT